MSHAFGKALLVISRDEDSRLGARRYSADVIIQRINGKDDAEREILRCWVREEFDLIDYRGNYPSRCREMEVGDTMRFDVSFHAHSWIDYWGEGDSTLDYTARLLRHQKFTSNRKRVKRYRLWMKQCAKKQLSQSSSPSSAS